MPKQFTDRASVTRKPATSAAKSQRVESKAEKALSLRIALENLEVPITIAARRLGLRVSEATALYVEVSRNEQARAYDLGLRDGKRMRIAS